MEKFVEDLKRLVRFKDTTAVGDIVLVAAQKPQMLVYALVTEIVRDESRQDEWWHVTLQFLVVPLQKAIWTLRMPQLTGLEIFTMDGEARFVKAVDFTADDEPASRNRPQLKKGGRPSALKRIK